MTKRIEVDPHHIEHTNEELMHYYYCEFARQAGIERRAAELNFRNVWDRMKRKLSSDRNHTYTVLKEHL